MKIRELRVTRPECNFNMEVVNVHATLDEDVSRLFPYLNATVEKAQYHPQGPFIRFMWRGHPVTAEPCRFSAGAFNDDDEARQAADDILHLFARVDEARDSIEPRHDPYHPPTVMDLFKLLPRQTGCGRCGRPTCMAFAMALWNRDAFPEQCSELLAPDQQTTLLRLHQLFSSC